MYEFGNLYALAGGRVASNMNKIERKQVENRREEGRGEETGKKRVSGRGGLKRRGMTRRGGVGKTPYHTTRSVEATQIPKALRAEKIERTHSSQYPNASRPYRMIELDWPSQWRSNRSCFDSSFSGLVSVSVGIDMTPMGGFALWFVLVRTSAFLLVVPVSTTPVARIPTRFVAQVPTALVLVLGSSASLGLVPRGVEVGGGQRIAGVRQAPTGPAAVLRLTSNCRLTS